MKHYRTESSLPLTPCKQHPEHAPIALARRAVRRLASRVLSTPERMTNDELETILRHSNLPYALAEFIRCEHEKVN